MPKLHASIKRPDGTITEIDQSTILKVGEEVEIILDIDGQPVEYGEFLQQVGVVSLRPNFKVKPTETGRYLLRANESQGWTGTVGMNVTVEGPPPPKQFTKGLVGADLIPHADHEELGVRAASFWYGLKWDDTTRPNSNWVLTYAAANTKSQLLPRMAGGEGANATKPPPGADHAAWKAAWKGRIAPILDDYKAAGLLGRLHFGSFNEPFNADGKYLNPGPITPEFRALHPTITDDKVLLPLWRQYVVCHQVMKPFWEVVKEHDPKWIVMSPSIVNDLPDYLLDLGAASFTDEWDIHPYGNKSEVSTYFQTIRARMMKYGAVKPLVCSEAGYKVWVTPTKEQLAELLAAIKSNTAISCFFRKESLYTGVSKNDLYGVFKSW